MTAQQGNLTTKTLNTASATVRKYLCIVVIGFHHGVTITSSPTDNEPSSSALEPAPDFVSIVVPMFNEEQGARQTVQRLQEVMNGMKVRYELCFVNDGSSDGTLAILKEAKQSNDNIRIIDLTRNFGHQMAITAGLDLVQGDAIIVIDGDLQDPPELIPELVAKWREGFDIVHARRRNREGETIFKRLTAKVYYRLIREISNVNIPVDVGDFRLISRRALEEFKKLREQHRYVRGLVAWLGYPHTFVEYDREKRFAGQTHYSLISMLRFSIAGVASFSVVPLRIASFFGVLSAISGGFYALYALYVHFVQKLTVIGWTSVVMIVLFIGGIQLICLGIIGEYIGIIHEEIKRRPLYLINQIF